jgi:hypothetical protein
MKKVKKSFSCNLCGIKWAGIPYAIAELKDFDEKYIICNAGCWKRFLAVQKEKMKNEIEDKVLMTKEAISFQELLEGRADYEEILDALNANLRSYRDEMEDSVVRTNKTQL